MSIIAATGAGGFLGWHLRIRNFSRTGEDVRSIHLGDGFDLADATAAIDGADRLVHVAGVNRGTAEEVARGNRLMAGQIAEALRIAPSPPETVVYANSIQAGNGSEYGSAKQDAARLLEDACKELGLTFVDLLLPNLFGEHGKPFYNSVVATFCHLTANGEPVQVQHDKELQLMHAQVAAEALLDAQASQDLDTYRTSDVTVSEIAQKLSDFHEIYSRSEIPDLTDSFDRDLFNTYRSYAFGARPAQTLEPRADQRGHLVETVKSHGGEGQTFFSTTRPGVVRGQHYHLRKIERFVVLAGEASLGLRRMFSTETMTINVNGDQPQAVDMPIGWVHNICNTGTYDDVLTQFWTNEIFNPDDTDTFYQEV
ncbi:capsular polysaccharide biosynthesis protein Cap8F [Citricoccus zhacaiensis]|uniref:Capsular polysaccharide biosynthesis protein Cap8F n=1 Tax=Citricoccus zhacaiensis TaxID=489142 RepID=A0ABQ2M3R2_9MICC|nr:NAD-dependent epimerase/dehydratase family protein [Citricoccus zhacaiensis]GGO46362.1 capsular polysaccharide biosynthesis protein Cap8F [Citricoccus zhacaiensis]